MNATGKNESARINKLVAQYNMIANLFWSVICLTPISFFCYTLMDTKLFWIFLIGSTLTAALPKSFFDRIQLGKTKNFYKKTGVLFINKFTQNGTIVNALIRKRIPGYKVVYNKNVSVKKLLNQTYMFEKFHFLLFVFFTLTTIYAIMLKFFTWAIIITVTNILYNVYPNILQQYIRLRLKAYAKNNVVK